MSNEKDNKNTTVRHTLAALGSCGQLWDLTVGYNEDDHRIMVCHKPDYIFPDQKPKPEQTGILALFDAEVKEANIHDWYTSKAERFILIGIATELGYKIQGWDNDIPY